MKNNVRLILIVLMLGLTLATARRALAQSASESFHEAGESVENAGSSAGHAVVHAYHGTATAAEDTAITAKVKTALHDDSLTKDGDIHVTTVASVVTLRGKVASSAVSERAQHLAEATGGVKRVRNRLHVKAASQAAN